ncbi:MAG: DUF1365 domain-containing protein [Parvibaculaceae bacterium]|nr:DUF1365 domain-containing protein [Parvibaculaceae bacterium]
MRTCIYKGSVHHTRRRPKQHRLHYRVFSLFIDLDELHLINAENKVLRINRPGLFSFWERDHGKGDPVGLKDWVLSHLEQSGFETDDVSVCLLCYPRILGYVFNPLSVYYCYDRHGQLMASLHEVNNTFGEKHTYILGRSTSPHAASYQQTAQKNLAVSPFTKMEGVYQFKMNLPNENLHLHIGLHDGQGQVMSASFTGKRHSISERALLLAFIQYPLMTLKVMLGIHVEALRLWLKGIPLITRTPAADPISYSHQSTTKSHISAD